jgi:ribosomal protein S18 acetylase RimI-like enzyme
MMGETALRIDRKPNFFKLLNARGESKVFVALDGDTIIGSLCVSLQEVYISGQIFPIHYIGDFKVSESRRNMGVGLQLCNELANYVIAQGADIAFLNVAKGNSKPFSFFKNRPNIPDFENIGIFKIHQFIGKKKRAFYPKNTVEQTLASDELIRFFNEHYCKYQLGSVITEKKLEGTLIFRVCDKNEIIAAMCLHDTMNIKQNIVTKLSWKMRYMLKVLNSLSEVLGISKMPFMNEPVRMIYIKYLAVNNCEKSLVRLLINHARNIAYDRSYSFASIGLHEKDILHKCFSGLSKLTFNSVGMILSIKGNRTLIEKVRQGVPFEDYSMV